MTDLETLLFDDDDSSLDPDYITEEDESDDEFEATDEEGIAEGQ